MIHELIEQKKKSQRANHSRNTKAFQDSKTVSQALQDPKSTAFEASDIENKEAESSSAVFIPPWLRHSLGLNQRNNLSNAAAGADSKPIKVVQKGKESCNNEFQALKANIEQDRRKKAPTNLEVLPREERQDVDVTQNSADVDTHQNDSERGIPVYWDLRRKESESESSCTNVENRSLKKNGCKISSGEAFVSTDAGKNKSEEKKRVKFVKAKNRVRKHASIDPKSDFSKNEIDLLLEIRAREALDSYTKGNSGSVQAELKHREPKFFLVGAKSHNQNNGELNKEEFRLLRELKNQAGGIEELDKVFEHVKDVHFREAAKNSDLSPKGLTEKAVDKEDKLPKSLGRKGNHEGNSKPDKDALMSTDDENDIKRFSEFLSKNKNLDEKRKCLEEVRNYFERKRRTRLTRRCDSSEEKPKPSPKSDRRDDQIKEKPKSREGYRRKRSKVALGEEAVEKAVDETLQKFVEFYHFRVSPGSLEAMKKNILQAIRTDAMEGGCLKYNELKIPPLVSKKINLEALKKESENMVAEAYGDRDIAETLKKDLRVCKESKKKSHRLADSFEEQISSSAREMDSSENEKLKLLRRDFEVFLHSVQGRVDFANLKLQSVTLEKEDSSPKGVQFVYNFANKVLEADKVELQSSQKDVMELKARKDSEIQTLPEPEVSKRSVKIQTTDHRSCCEQSLQTEDTDVCTRQTQTEGKGVTVREISELKGHEVSAGLYRMVKSQDAGKFYLYPEENEKEEDQRPSRCYITKKKKSKRLGLLSITPKERRIISKEKEKSRLRKMRKSLPCKKTSLKNAFGKRKKNGETSEDSVNCLYFRNPDKKVSDSLSSKKDLTDETVKDQFDSEEIVTEAKEDHLGCFWFWNGQKITPGCDLKTHVENIVKEKLTEMTAFEGQQNDLLALQRPEPEQMVMCNVSQKNDGRAVNTLFCYNNLKNHAKEVSVGFTIPEGRKKNEGQRKENGESERPAMSPSEEKAVKNVATQNSESLSLSMLKLTTQSKFKSTIKRKCTRRNIIIKPASGRGVTLRKAEDIIRAVEEIKKMKLGLGSANNDSILETEVFLGGSSSTIGSNKNETEEPTSVVLGIHNNPRMEHISNVAFKNELEKLMCLVDREVQTADGYDCEDSNSAENEVTEPPQDRIKHLELIESVLGRVNQKERENLWNDVRDFIKTKIGRDINDEGAREVCIEIEQDVPKIEQGNMRQSIMARGHYSKNEGDVEVEIDLTLDDLAKILRQRQRKIRRRNLCRSSKSKSLLSSSSVQSDFTRDDLRRYHKYLQRFATAEGNFLQDKELRVFQKNKAN